MLVAMPKVRSVLLEKESTGASSSLGIATSIDALAVGISMAFLQTDILLSACLIASTTFVLSFAGVGGGFRFGKIQKLNAELAGGVILIAIGIKILVEHMWM